MDDIMAINAWSEDNQWIDFVVFCHKSDARDVQSLLNKGYTAFCDDEFGFMTVGDFIEQALDRAKLWYSIMWAPLNEDESEPADNWPNILHKITENIKLEYKTLRHVYQF